MDETSDPRCARQASARPRTAADALAFALAEQPRLEREVAEALRMFSENYERAETGLQRIQYWTRIVEEQRKQAA